MKKFLQKFFKLEEKGTSVRIEVLAGITTFLAMAYILPVNAGLLSMTGMSFAAVLIATALSAAIATLIMGLYAKYPVALAPGMGVNAFFTYTVVFMMGMSWQMALAAVLVSGVLFLIISVSGLRRAIINAIPKGLKLAVGVGIGFFIAFIGLKNAGFVVIEIGEFAPGIPQLGNLLDPAVVLFVVGLLGTAILYGLKVKGAIFYGMAGTLLLGIIGGAAGLAGMPSITTGTEFSLAPLGDTFGQAFKALPDLFKHPEWFVVIFTFLFIDFFDTAGTLMAVGEQAELLDENGQLIDGDKALLADSVGTITGAVLGTSTVTSYIESGAGIAAGGRSGLTAVVTGLLFLLSVFLWPFLMGLTAAVTAPALVMVGVLMAQGAIKKIDWDDFPMAISAFLVILVMVLSFSIAEGIAVGFIFYPIMKLATGKGKDVHMLMYVLAVLFIGYFTFL